MLFMVRGKWLVHVECCAAVCVCEEEGSAAADCVAYVLTDKTTLHCCFAITGFMQII